MRTITETNAAIRELVEEMRDRDEQEAADDER